MTALGFTGAEGASRAGVEPAFVDRLCELGMLRAAEGAFTEGDMRRTRIFRSLTNSGLPLEALGEGTRTGASTSAIDGVRFEPIGPVELKGMSEAVSLHAASRSG